MTRRALIVPDARSWLLWGRDLRAEGYIAAASPAAADVLIAPRRVPAALAQPLREAWAAMPLSRELVTPADPVGVGDHAREVLADGAGHQEHHGGHDGHHDHHDHHEMMAVTGDPSADGLVMEDLEFEVGPLTPVLPGGLVARLTVDGDVVCKAELRPTLDAAGAPIPDPTATAAWRAALGYAGERAQGRGPTADTRRDRVIAVELERAVSHATWFADLGDLLGWAELADAGRETAVAVLGVTPDGDGLDAPESKARSLARLINGSRRLAFRLGDLARLALRDVDRLAIAGPNARAAGLAVDARTRDPAYSTIGFTPSIDEAGDAAARARVRARELVAALDLVRRAVGAAFGGSSDVPEAVEGPRGPVAVHVASEGGPCMFVAHGAVELPEAVADRLEGLEWAAAMTAIASFDLSGWKVPS